MIRSHKTEKALLVQTQSLLGEEALDQIARFNPQSYLKMTY